MNRKKTFLLIIFIGVLITAINGQTSPEYKILFEKAKFTMETKGDLNGAIALFNDIIKKYPKEREYAAKSQLYIGLCYEKLGVKEAQKAYQRVVSSYPEQTESVKLANEKLSLLMKAEAPAARDDKELSIRRVKELSGMGVLGTVSPDSRYLSYAEDGSLDLTIYEIATGNKRILVKGDIESDAYYSRWSPDGKLVAYTWYHDNGQIDLRIIGLDGTGPRVLYNDSRVTWIDLEDWSPDGKSILIILSLEDKTCQMVLVSVQDSSVQVLKDFDKLEPGPSRFSRDGRYIAYTLQQSRESREKDIFVHDLNGGSETQLIQDPADDIVLDWTPDGNGILFRSDRTGTVGLWWLNVIEGQSRGTPELLKPDLGPDFIPMGFTRNGLYYSGILKEVKDVYIAELDLVTGKLISAPSLATQRFAGSNNCPNWSADGQQLLYLSQRVPGAWGARTICVRSTVSGKVHEIFSKLNQLAWVRWSPDGRFLLTGAANPDGGYGTFKIDIQTGEYKYLMEPHIGWPAAWSNDNKTIFSYRAVSDTGRLPIVVQDLETGQWKEIYNLTFSNSSYYTTGLALSRDGEQLAFSVTESGSSIIKVIPSMGGEVRELLREDEDKSLIPIAFGSMAWASDGRSLLFVRSTTPGGSKTELWQMPLQGGEPRKLELVAENMHDLSVHPDGRHIAFTAGKPKSEIWVMENFLPNEKAETSNQLTLKKLDYPQLNTEFASLSPDGRYISYPDWNTGDLAIHDMVTGKDRQLTNKGSWAESNDYAGFSLFSTDSKKVAYTWRIWSKNQTELRIIGTDGSQSRVIYKGDDSWPVSWSSNGKYILVKLMNKDQTWRPAIITVADSSVRDLTFQISGALCFSPDGKYIAYDTPQAKDAQQRDVYLYDFATKRILPLIKHPADDGLLGWAPDGKHLLFTSDRSGTRDAWLVTVSDGKIQGEPILVRKNMGEIEDIGFTKSGDFYFHESVGGHNIFTAKLDFDSGKLLSQPVETAGSYLGSNWRPDFSRDGKFMAYISNRGSAEELGNTIVIGSLETGKERLLMPALEIGFGLRWVPDGNSLFVNGTDKNKKEGLFRVDAQTGEARLIVERHFVGAPGLEISPDGNVIFYTAVAGSGIPDGEAAYDVRHYAFDLQTSQEKELAHPGNTPLVPIVLSPDGKQLAFIGAGDKAGSAGICIIPVSGGPSKQLVNIGGTGWASRVIAWTPDGRYLIYAVMLTKTQNTDLGQTSWQLWRVSAEGGEPQRLDLKIDGLLRHLRIHPDGQQIVYYTWRGDTEAWVMQNFLPK
jgi:Tol biopolymer transport system component